MAVEQTLSIIKPDAVKKNVIGKIIARFEAAGLRVVAARMMHLSRKEAEGFYAVHRERPFFKDLVEFMISGPVLVQVLEGENAIAKNRELMGATDPKKAAKGTIRADFADSIDANAVHGSDGPETARKEIAYFFPKDTEMKNLLGLDADGLERFFAAQGEKPFRARQVLRWVHQRGEADFAQMSDLAKELREKLVATASVEAPQIVGDTAAADGTRKWLLKVDGANAVEAVFIPETSRGTLCVSSQAGCVLDCAFCSTGKQGFNRNLSTAEIVGQLWLANRLLDGERDL